MRVLGYCIVNSNGSVEYHYRFYMNMEVPDYMLKKYDDNRVVIMDRKNFNEFKRVLKKFGYVQISPLHFAKCH